MEPLLSILNNKAVKIASVIVLASLTLSVSSVWNDSPITDEIPHIGSGYSYVAKGDYRLNPEHPPLAKDLAGIGVALTKPSNTSFETKYWLEDINGQWEFGRHLIFQSGSNTDKLIRFAKLPQLIFFILSAVLVFKWTSRIYNRKTGLLALFLFSFSPTIIAHSRFVTTDMPALFGVLLASYLFINFLKDPSRRNIIYAGLALGIAQLAKFSVFLLNPFFLVLAILFGLISKHNKIKRLWTLSFKTILIIVIAYIVVWIWYIPHVKNYPPELQKYHTEDLLKSYGNRKVAEPVVYLSDKPIVRAIAQYGLGLLMVTQRTVGGNTTYFLGEVSKDAWKKYFPIVYFIKEPLPFWIMFISVLLFLSAKVKSLKIKFSPILEWARNRFDELAMLLWIGLYWYVSIDSNLNIGVRHLIPVYGFTFILLSGQMIKIGEMIKEQGLRAKKMLITYSLLLTALLGWYLYENLNVYPSYLTYFNQIAGGPENGFYYVVDSNVDWGQDLKRLSMWMKENNVDIIYLDYFGWSEQYYYLKNNFVWLQSHQYSSKKEFLDANPNGGYIGVSATFYMGFLHEAGHSNYGWLKLKDRVATIGNSIFIWEVRPQ